MSDLPTSISATLNDFHRARNRAKIEDIISRLAGRPNDLLSYEEVRRLLHAQVGNTRQLRDIPLDAIVGSVGRYADFNRHFLPRSDSTGYRWVAVKHAMSSMRGVPPIEVYQIGDAYFVLDGNHRVSVARELGEKTIQAYVTPVRTRVPLTPDTSPDDLILKAEQAAFLEATELDTQRPDADLTITVPGQFRQLEAEIEARRQALERERGRPVTTVEAAADWYDHVYLPVVQLIRRHGLLRDFPGRTETDLYAWISEHRQELERQLGWPVDPADAAVDLASRRSPTAARVAARLGGQLLGAVTPPLLEAGPPPGAWRRARDRSDLETRFSADALVAISGTPAGWCALDQALIVARREGGRLNGLHVVASEAARESPAAQAVRAEFDRRCAEAGVAGNLVIEAGNVTELLCDRARWNDLVIVSVSYPPGNRPLKRLTSGLRALIQRCPRPILAVPGSVTPLDRALLAYDGSPKSEEALAAAAYLALQWKIELVVVTVVEGYHLSGETQMRARRYLEEHGVTASYVLEYGSVAENILKTAATRGCDLLLMGGYGLDPLREVVLGSTVDEVLRRARLPVLLCR